MPVADLLLTEFDAEMKHTRETLRRVPSGKNSYVPHPKSMPLERLAPHVAQLTEFGAVVLTTPSLDFANASFKPLEFKSADQLVQVLDDGAAKVRGILKAMPDSAWTENWKLSFQGKPIFEGSRFLA